MVTIANRQFPNSFSLPTPKVCSPTQNPDHQIICCKQNDAAAAAFFGSAVFGNLSLKITPPSLHSF